MKRTVIVKLSGIDTDVTVVAKRGAVLYGYCVTPRHSIALVELLQIPDGQGGSTFKVEEMKSTTIHELLRDDKRLIENNLRVSVRVFVGNAHLKEQFPELEAKLTAKVLELANQIQPAEVYNF